MKELGGGDIDFFIVCQILSFGGVQEPVLSTQLQLDVERGPLGSPLPAPRDL